METAGIPTSPSVMELQARLHKAEVNAAREKRLRGNYYNHQCRIKKEWEKKKVDFKIEISCLKRRVCDQEEEIQAQRETIQKLTEENASAEKDLNLFEAMLSERDRRILKHQSDYKKLMDELIAAKMMIEEL